MFEPGTYAASSRLLNLAYKVRPGATQRPQPSHGLIPGVSAFPVLLLLRNLP